MLIGCVAPTWSSGDSAPPTVGYVCSLVALGGTGLAAFAAVGRVDSSGVAVARANSFTYVGFLLGAGLIGPGADLSTMRVAFVIPMALAVVVLLNVRRVTSSQPAVAGPVVADAV